VVLTSNSLTALTLQELVLKEVSEMLPLLGHFPYHNVLMAECLTFQDVELLAANLRLASFLTSLKIKVSSFFTYDPILENLPRKLISLDLEGVRASEQAVSERRLLPPTSLVIHVASSSPTPLHYRCSPLQLPSTLNSIHLRMIWRASPVQNPSFLVLLSPITTQSISARLNTLSCSLVPLRN